VCSAASTPAEITTYQINADPRTIQGNAVLVPSIGGDNMQAVLAVFRGQATLGDAPVQVLETAPDTATTPSSEHRRPPSGRRSRNRHDRARSGVGDHPAERAARREPVRRRPGQERLLLIAAGV
jgi:hypothetical protein